MNKLLIVTGGSIDASFAMEYLAKHEFDYIIAADSGLNTLDKLQMIPDVILGDFDSVDVSVLECYRNQDIEIHTFDPVKDSTDTEIAMRLAIKKQPKEVHILGATGTRIDHMLANVSLLGLFAEYGIEAYLVDAQNRIRMIRENMVIRKAEQYGEYLSLVPYCGEVTGVTLRGFKYPLNHVVMEGFSSLGISNEIVDEVAEIELEAGYLLVIESKDN